MADPFVAEIRMFPFNFAPKNWAFCNGQILPLAQNTALFSLLGTYYGGNGLNNFALPDLQNRTPLQQGQGAGLSQRELGEAGGAAAVTLQENQVPSHNHQLQHAGTVATSGSPGGAVSFGSAGVAQVYSVAGGTPVTLQRPVGPVGDGLPHNNRQPFLVLNFCIALTGVYPQRP